MGITDEDIEKWKRLTVEYRNEPGDKDPKFWEIYKAINEKVLSGKPLSHNDPIDLYGSKKHSDLSPIEQELTTLAFHLFSVH